MLSQLAAQIMPFFRLMARNLTFRDKKYRILTFRDKTELYLAVLQQNNIEACLRCEASFSGSLSGSFWLSLALSLALSGSLWISRACFLALFGSLLLSQALYCSPNLLSKSSLGSQGHCSARSSAAALHDFMLVWCILLIVFWSVKIYLPQNNLEKNTSYTLSHKTKSGGEKARPKRGKGVRMEETRLIWLNVYLPLTTSFYSCF